MAAACRFLAFWGLPERKRPTVTGYLATGHSVSTQCGSWEFSVDSEASGGKIRPPPLWHGLWPSFVNASDRIGREKSKGPE